jgi:hypothetical protein
MGLPQPLGPYEVSFADFELRRTEELQPSQSGGGGGGGAAAEPQQKQQQQQQLETNGIQQNGGQALPQDLEETPATVAVAGTAPLMRIFYPTEAKTRWSALDAKQRCWVPNYNYMWGFVAKAIPPTSFFVKICISFISCKTLSTLPLALPLLSPFFCIHQHPDGIETRLFSAVRITNKQEVLLPLLSPPPCPRLSASTQIWMHRDPALSAVRITNKHLLANIHT